jgi:hypothetical protein
MTERIRKAKKNTTPKKDQTWFERKVAELKADLEKLPADRAGELLKRLER